MRHSVIESHVIHPSKWQGTQVLVSLLRTVVPVHVINETQRLFIRNLSGEHSRQPIWIAPKTASAES